MNGSILEQDIDSVVDASFIPWDELKNKVIFITGGTGLIGYTLINALVKADEAMGLGIRIYALVRDIHRANERFAGIIGNTPALELVSGTVEGLGEHIPRDIKIDYIIHGASQTSSRFFIEHPVETIDTAVKGTGNVLELARRNKVEGFIYLSSMEVYGYPERGHKVSENEIGALSPLDVRNSYPISKVMCEAMCTAYAEEYGVAAKIIRLTQTFGPGVNYNDERIFAYFLRCICEKKDIVLKTRGETERSYLYTIDAVTAILTVLLKGEPGEVYNAADEETYCSIKEMAHWLAVKYGINVRFDIQDEAANGYPKTLYMDLDTSGLRNLGWSPMYSLTRHLNCM